MALQSSLGVTGSNEKRAGEETEFWVLAIDKTPSTLFPRNLETSQGRLWYPGSWGRELEPLGNSTAWSAETWRGSSASIQRIKQGFKFWR